MCSTLLRFHRALRRRTGSGDDGHEAVGQALLISIGLAGMVAASRLSEVAVQGMVTVMDALR